MAKRKKYRLKKRVKNFLIFYTFICILFLSNYTLSRYIESTEETVGIDIAKFKVTVNDINVSDGIPIQFNFSDNSTFVKGKVVPNGKGYFEFTINPDGTEVSLEYEIKFMLEELDEDFKLEYFTINDGETHYDITDGNIAKKDLLLPTTEKGFTDADKINIKVYWYWDEQDEILNPDIDIYDNKDMNILVIVKQKIN